MASQPLFLQQVPVDEMELRAVLQSAAMPGYSGSITIEIGLRAEARSYIMLGVMRRESRKPGAGQRQMLPDPERRKPVENVIEELRPKLFVRPILRAVEAHYDNGVLTKFNIVE